MMGPTNSKLRTSLRTMPVRVPPSELQTSLRIIASRESQRRRTRATWVTWLAAVREDLRVHVNNLMRPIAIPTAGGFVSALMLFGVLAPSLAIPPVTRANDVPTVLYTEPSVKNFLPIGFEGDGDLVVEITVDENGKLVDYSIPNMDDKLLRMHRSIENQILFTQFTPATRLGQPMSGKVRLTFLSSHINVKG